MSLPNDQPTAASMTKLIMPVFTKSPSNVPCVCETSDDLAMRVDQKVIPEVRHDVLWSLNLDWGASIFDI